jgi:hypothetical protein
MRDGIFMILDLPWGIAASVSVMVYGPDQMPGRLGTIWSLQGYDSIVSIYYTS